MFIESLMVPNYLTDYKYIIDFIALPNTR